MDAALFAKMLSDKSVTDLKKLNYKYPNANIREFTELLKSSVAKPLPLKDFDGHGIIYLDSVAQVHMNAAKILLTPQSSGVPFGQKAMEDEIASSLTIEDIDFTRDSVRKIMTGYAPSDESENRIYGMKKGLEFISDPAHKITEENIHTLYQTAIGNYLPANDMLQPGALYRHDSVYVVGQEVEHTGLPWQKLPEYMGALVDFIASESPMNDLLKAAVIHFYIGFLHPYFDGNGRLARLLHLWYLVQQGYSSALFIPLSEYIEKSRRSYYNAYTLTEQNAALSGTLDVTPFLVYFIENVYHKLSGVHDPRQPSADFQRVLAEGSVTEKERDLWYYVLSAYGTGEFSTKQLEKDYGHAAYATIRGFVLKFEKLGLLTVQKYGNRVKYRIRIN